MVPKANEFGEITQNKGHYAVQGHSRSLILVPIERSYAASYYWLILTYPISCTVSMLRLIIGQIFSSHMGCFTLMPSLGVIPCEYPDKLYLSRNRNDCGTWHRRPHDRIFISRDKTPEREGRTDGRTNGRTEPRLLQRSALRAMRTRCKNSISRRYDSMYRYRTVYRYSRYVEASLLMMTLSLNVQFMYLSSIPVWT